MRAGVAAFFEFRRAAIDMQDAVDLLVVLDIGFLAQRLQNVAAVQRDAQRAVHIDAFARARAIAQELQAPRPQLRIEAPWPEQQRGVRLERP